MCCNYGKTPPKEPEHCRDIQMIHANQPFAGSTQVLVNCCTKATRYGEMHEKAATHVEFRRIADLWVGSGGQVAGKLRALAGTCGRLRALAGNLRATCGQLAGTCGHLRACIARSHVVTILCFCVDLFKVDMLLPVFHTYKVFSCKSIKF